MPKWLNKWLKSLVRPKLDTLETTHRDGFVYEVTLRYELPPRSNTPHIRLIDDGGIVGDKFLLPHEQETFLVQFGGEPGRPAVYAQMQFGEVEEDWRPTSKNETHKTPK